MSESNERLLRNGKRVSVAKVASAGPSESLVTSDALGPTTPVKKAEGETASHEPVSFLEKLPAEIMELVVKHLTTPKALCALEMSASKLRDFLSSQAGQHQWKTIFEEEFGTITHIQTDAAAIAGSWKSLYASKLETLKTFAPWERASPFEVDAAIHRLLLLPKTPTATTTPITSICVCFLVDGSGSVTEDDFACMTEFMLDAHQKFTAAVGGDGNNNNNNNNNGNNSAEEHKGLAVKCAVLQFSNDARLELPPMDVGGEQFESAVHLMHRINGGTNIALAIQKAGALLKDLPPTTARVIALLTDGRIDAFQAREAQNMASRLADEQGCVAFHAFGVGRGVDIHELLNIIGGGFDRDDEEDKVEVESRYLNLCVLDEAPW